MEKIKSRIRQAKIGDLSVLDKFQQEIIQFERSFTPNIKPGYVTYYNLKEIIKNEKAKVLVATIDDKIVGSGYAIIKESSHYKQPEHYGYLGFMYVLPEYRRKGVISMLIQELVGWIKQMGVYEIQLDVYATNDTAINAYKKLGFKPDMLKMRLNTNELL